MTLSGWEREAIIHPSYFALELLFLGWGDSCVGGQGSIPVRRGSISVLTTDVLAPDFLTVWADGVDKSVIYDPRRSASRSRPDCRSFIKRKLGGKWWTKPHPDDDTIHTRLLGSFGFSKNSLALTKTPYKTWYRVPTVDQDLPQELI